MSDNPLNNIINAISDYSGLTPTEPRAGGLPPDMRGDTGNDNEQPNLGGLPPDMRQEYNNEIQPPQSFIGGEDYVSNLEQWRNTAQLDESGKYYLAPSNSLGEQLPYGALGWDYYGDPYYGQGLAGEWNKLTSKLFAPIGRTNEPWFYIDSNGQWHIDMNQVLGKVPTETANEETANNEALQKAKEISQNMGIPASQMVIAEPISTTWRNLYNGEGGLFTVPLRLISTGIEGLLDTFQEAADGVERIFSLANQMGTVLGNYGSVGHGLPATVTQPLPNNPWLNDYQTATGYDIGKYFKENYNPLTWNNIKTGNILKEGSAAEKAWLSGEFFYSTAVDPMLRNEIDLELASGKDYNLIMQKLQNPLAELVGEIILDPTNLLMGNFGVSSKLAKNSNKLLEIPDEVKDILQSVDKLDEATAVEKYSQLAKYQIENVNKLSDIIENLSSKIYGGEAKYNLTQIMKSVFHGMEKSAVYDPDDFALAVEGLIRIASKQEDEVVEGLRILKSVDGLPPELFMSKAGTYTGLVLRNYLGVDETGDMLKSLNKITDDIANLAKEGNIEAVATYLSKKAEKAIDKMIPTFDTKLKLYNDISKGINTAPTPAEMEIYNSISKGQRVVYTLIKDNEKIMKPFNTFFSAIYMGLSPAYAMRNAMQNTVTAVLDYGPRVLKPYSKAHAQRVFGGVLPDFVQKGIGAMNATERYGLGKFDILEFGKLASQKAESFASLNISTHLYEDTLMKTLKEGRAIPKVEDLLKAGWSEDIINSLMKSIVNNYGDVDKAIEELGIIQEGAKIAIDPTKLATFLDDDTAKVLRDLNVYDDITDIIKDGRKTNKIPSEIAGDINKYIDNLLENASAELKKGGVNIAEVDDVLQAITPQVIEDSTDAEDVAKSLIANNRYSAVSLAYQRIRDFFDDKIDDLVSKTIADYNFDPTSLGNKPDDVIKTLIATKKNFNDYINAVNEHISILRPNLVAPRNTYLAQFKNAAKENERLEVLAKFANWMKDTITKLDVPDKDNILKLLDETPKDDFKVMNEIFWNGLFYPVTDKITGESLSTLRQMMETANLGLDQETDNILRYAEQYVNLSSTTRYYEMEFYNELIKGNYKNALYSLAQSYGIKGVENNMQSMDKYILQIITDYSDNPKLQKMKSLDDIVSAQYYDDIRNAFSNFMYDTIRKTNGNKTKEFAKAFINDLPNEIPLKNILTTVPPYDGLTAPSYSRIIWESRGALREAVSKATEELGNVFGRIHEMDITPDKMAVFNKWVNEAKANIAMSRTMAYNVARAGRDFSLLPYEKGLFDHIAGMIFPYQYWYSRTYLNWMKRMTTSNGLFVASKYAAYKDALSQIHAGSPDWWKYNVNSNELLGLNSRNPYYFNMEATLNPLYGMVGVDYNDPRKRVDWLSGTVDQMGKFGPTLFTPYNWLMALRLYKMNEVDAAKRWAGRLIPQSQPLKAALWKAGVKFYPYGESKALNEIDPIVQLSGGYDPYESKKILRQLSAMEENGQISPAELVDAAYFNEGNLWDMAAQTYYQYKFPSLMSSFFLGVGFKGRTPSDMQIDMFYNDLYRIQALSKTITMEEKQKMYRELYSKYPFGESLLLGVKGGLDRDEAFTWNVLDRIAPGKTDDIFRSFGDVSYKLLQNYYDADGDLSQMGENDRNQFMATVVNVAAVLEVPPNATKQEWDEASAHYKELMAWGESMFGKDIWDKITEYNQLSADYTNYNSYNMAQSMLDADPTITAAKQWKAQTILNDPILARYYGGISVVESYYKGLKSLDITNQLGDDIFLKNSIYMDYRNNNQNAEAKDYLKQHPELIKYWELNDQWNSQIDKYIIDLANNLPEGYPMQIREEAKQSIVGTSLLDVIQEQTADKYYQQPYSYYANMFSDAQRYLIEDYIEQGINIPEKVYSRIEYLAERLGISAERLLAIMEYSYYNNR